MRTRIASICIVAFISSPANCQSATPQISKEWALGQGVARDLEQRDGRITDEAITEYLQHTADTIAAAGVQPVEIRVTRSPYLYAALEPGRIIVISGGLLDRAENEMELAGLLAHEIAHSPLGRSTAQGQIFSGGCVLASPSMSLAGEDTRGREFDATTKAVGYLRSAGYDPAGVLDLFSKLSYEHPVWAKAVVPDDLLQIRTATESYAVPSGGYRVDSAEFSGVHSRLETALGIRARNRPSLFNQPQLRQSQ